MPETYRFHFLSQNTSLTTSTIYFENRYPLELIDHAKFLGSIEFVNSEDQKACLDLVYLSEKQKIAPFAGSIKELREEFPFEFSTYFTIEGVEYSNFHLVDQQADSQLFHVTLLSGFTNTDIELVRQFNQSICFGGVSLGLNDGDVLDIQFEETFVEDSDGSLVYLN